MASKAKGSKAMKAQEQIDEEEYDSDELIVGDAGGFEDEAKRPQFREEETKKKVQHEQVVHLHFQQRTTRKCLTIVQGLPDDLDFKKILRQFKKAWCCNGSIIEQEEWGNVIQLQGDHRREISKFLIEEGLASKDMIKIHGY